jgi:hypothetical protein
VDAVRSAAEVQRGMMDRAEDRERQDPEIRAARAREGIGLKVP